MLRYVLLAAGVVTTAVSGWLVKRKFFAAKEDAVPDIVASGGFLSTPRVRVFNGVIGAQIPGPLGAFMAFDPDFRGGVRLAACDLTGDNVAEPTTGATGSLADPADQARKIRAPLSLAVGHRGIGRCLACA